MYRSFQELAAKQSHQEPAANGKKVSALTVAQPKKAGSRERQQFKMIPSLPPSLSCSSTDRLGTIEEGECEEGSPIPQVTAASDPTAAAKVATDSSIWEEGETIPSNDGDGEHNEHENVGSNNNGRSNGTGEETSDESSPGAFSLKEPKLQQQQEEEDDGTYNDAQKETCNACSDGDGDGDETPMSYTPAPRTSVGVVPVGFTTRLFPTPLRESKMADESAWIMKNRSHLHKNKALVGRLPPNDSGSSAGGGREDLPIDISESDPVWLKGRGDDLYRGGDFLGAVNAYTAALDADPKAAACLSNRAACHLRLCSSRSDDARSHSAACVADCGAALEILQALPETGPSQAKALARRALAYRELGHYRSSLEDCRAALAFSPGDATLLEDIARGEPLARAEQCKKEAATRFASGDIVGACELYTAALEAVPSFPSALSNRAACYLALWKPRECVRDCTAVLEMLSVSGPACSSGDTSSSTIPFGDGGADGSGGSESSYPPGGGTGINIDIAAAATTTGTTPGTTSGEHTPQLTPSVPAAIAGEATAASSKLAVVAPSSSPPLPPPPVGSMPPTGSEKRTKWILATVLRRARANVQLENLEGALRDYRTANSVSPGDKAVEADIRELEQRTNEAARSLSSRSTAVERTTTAQEV